MCPPPKGLRTKYPSDAMIAATATAMPPVVTAMPLMPGATAAERLAHAQARVDQLDLLVDEKFEGLGEAGITRPKDALLFTNGLEYKAGAVQQLTCKCMFCNIHISSTGATRVVDHLTACYLCPVRVKQPLAEVRAGTAKKRKTKKEHMKLVHDQAADNLNEIKQVKALQRQQTLCQSLSAAESEVADCAIARFFYANGLGFAAADSQPGSYYRAMVDAIKATKPSYVPPSSNKIAGPLLDACHQHMEADIEKRDASGQLSERFGLTYTSDGWEDCNSMPLINSAYILANDGGVYLRSVDTSGMTKSGEYTANLMIEDIIDIGPTRVVCVVTDTCNTMRKAWKIVEKEFPWISCCPCQTHCPSLLLNDIGKLPEPAQTLKDESLVVGWCSMLHVTTIPPPLNAPPASPCVRVC